ncbi:MAG: MATE family efflux transporter [Clostridiales bacterium]|nr:MATE family efflux transporter [Clostridiales bacterium]
MFWMLIFGFTSGNATFMAQFFGSKDFVNIRRTTGFALTVNFCVGVLFFLVAFLLPRYVLMIFTNIPEVIEAGIPYVRTGSFCFLLIPITQSFTIALRATQQTHLPLISSVTGFCTNTFLNYCLIYGHFGMPRLEIQGAAAATVVARLVEMSILFYFVFARNNIIKGEIREYFSYSRELARRIVKNAIPTTINETLWGLGTAMYVAAFARIGITAGAAYQACNTISNIFSMLAFSVGDAALIMIGQKLGEGKTGEAYEMGKKMLLLAVSIGVVMGGVSLLLGKPILGLFNFTPAGADMAWKTFIVFACMLWLDVFNGTIVVGILRCGGDTKFAAFADVGPVWLYGVPMAFLTALKLGWPIYFAVLAVRLGEVIKGVILTVRFLSRKWVNIVIKDL